METNTIILITALVTTFLITLVGSVIYLYIRLSNKPNFDDINNTFNDLYAAISNLRDELNEKETHSDASIRFNELHDSKLSKLDFVEYISQNKK